MIIEQPDDGLPGGPLYDTDRRDQLFGGEGADTFILNRDGKTDTVHAFKDGEDKIDLSDFDVMADQMSIKMIDIGEYVITIRDERTRILLEPTDVDEMPLDFGVLDADDFIFADGLAQARLSVQSDSDSPDRLFGTTSPDVFILNPDGARDAIRRFEMDKDIIDLAGYNTSFASLEFIDKKPGRVLINIPNGDGTEALVVHDTSKHFTADDFTADMFIF